MSQLTMLVLLFRILMGSIKKWSLYSLRMRNLPVNTKLKSSNENLTITIIISSLELHGLPWAPGELTSLFNLMFVEGSVQFRVSHTVCHWSLRSSFVQCWVCSDREGTERASTQPSSKALWRGWTAFPFRLCFLNFGMGRFDWISPQLQVI